MKERKSIGIKKTIETKNEDGDTDKLKVTKLDDNSAFEEIINTLREFSVFRKENELFKDYKYDDTNLSDV